MIRLGLLDFDTSHAVEFTKRLNHVDSPEAQWVNGAKVVVGCPGESKVSPERIDGFAAALKKYGVPLVDQPEDMIGKVDGMLIEAVDGSVHLARAKPFLDAGIPCFVDKPFACAVADAKAILALAEKKKVPVFSASALRYAPEVVAYVADAKHGPVHGCVTWGPGSEHDRNPGLFHYGVHAVEMLYAVLGPGCKRVSATYTPQATVVTGEWADGRTGTVRSVRTGASGFGLVAYAAKAVTPLAVPSTFIYRELLKQVVALFEKKASPLDPREMLEVVAFMAAANASGANHAAPVALAT